MSDGSTQTAESTTQAVTGEAQAAPEIKTAEAASAQAAPATSPETTKGTPAEAKPEVTFSLKLPDGSLLDQAHVEKVTSFAKERGLSNDQAQAILERDHQEKSAFVEANKPGGVEWTKKVNGWEAAALADKEIGGTPEALQANAELGKRVIAKYFPESIKSFLDETGFGSHPEVLRGFVKLGKAMSDDKMVHPGSQSSGNPKSLEDIFYGSKK